MKVFVYGTLRKGGGNHFLLEGLAGEPAIAHGVRGAHDGSLPWATLSDGSTLVGELYELPEGPRGAEVLANLDGLEGYSPGRADNLYDRVEVTVGTVEDGLVTASMYVAGAWAQPRMARMVPMGDYADISARVAMFGADEYEAGCLRRTAALLGASQ